MGGHEKSRGPKIAVRFLNGAASSMEISVGDIASKNAMLRTVLKDTRFTLPTHPNMGTFRGVAGPEQELHFTRESDARVMTAQEFLKLIGHGPKTIEEMNAERTARTTRRATRGGISIPKEEYEQRRLKGGAGAAHTKTSPLKWQQPEGIPVPPRIEALRAKFERYQGEREWRDTEAVELATLLSDVVPSSPGKPGAGKWKIIADELNGYGFRSKRRLLTGNRVKGTVGARLHRLERRARTGAKRETEHIRQLRQNVQQLLDRLSQQQLPEGETRGPFIDDYAAMKIVELTATIATECHSKPPWSILAYDFDRRFKFEIRTREGKINASALDSAAARLMAMNAKERDAFWRRWIVNPFAAAIMVELLQNEVALVRIDTELNAQGMLGTYGNPLRTATTVRSYIRKRFGNMSNPEVGANIINFFYRKAEFATDTERKRAAEIAARYSKKATSSRP